VTLIAVSVYVRRMLNGPLSRRAQRVEICITYEVSRRCGADCEIRTGDVLLVHPQSSL
jgi:hypothetical protein